MTHHASYFSSLVTLFMATLMVHLLMLDCNLSIAGASSRAMAERPFLAAGNVTVGSKAGSLSLPINALTTAHFSYVSILLKTWMNLN
jgi:hypothetical protein